MDQKGRNEKKWKDKMLPFEINKFPPRIKKDLETIPFPDKVLSVVENSYYIHSPSGHGKTILSAFIFLEERKRMYLNDIPGECVFMNYNELFNDLKNAFNDNEESKRILDRLRECHFLVIDDFGSKMPGNWLLDVLYLIINYRYEYLKPTVITSNYDLKELAEELNDDRIPSRINRMCKILKKEHYAKS